MANSPRYEKFIEMVKPHNDLYGFTESQIGYSIDDANVPIENRKTTPNPVEGTPIWTTKVNTSDKYTTVGAAQFRKKNNDAWESLDATFNNLYLNGSVVTGSLSGTGFNYRQDYVDANIDIDYDTTQMFIFNKDNTDGYVDFYVRDSRFRWANADSHLAVNIPSTTGIYMLAFDTSGQLVVLGNEIVDIYYDYCIVAKVVISSVPDDYGESGVATVKPTVMIKEMLSYEVYNADVGSIVKDGAMPNLYSDFELDAYQYTLTVADEGTIIFGSSIVKIPELNYTNYYPLLFIYKNTNTNVTYGRYNKDTSAKKNYPVAMVQDGGKYKLQYNSITINGNGDIDTAKLVNADEYKYVMTHYFVSNTAIKNSNNTPYYAGFVGLGQYNSNSEASDNIPIELDTLIGTGVIPKGMLYIGTSLAYIKDPAYEAYKLVPFDGDSQYFYDAVKYGNRDILYKDGSLILADGNGSIREGTELTIDGITANQYMTLPGLANDNTGFKVLTTDANGKIISTDLYSCSGSGAPTTEDMVPSDPTKVHIPALAGSTPSSVAATIFSSNSLTDTVTCSYDIHVELYQFNNKFVIGYLDSSNTWVEVNSIDTQPSNQDNTVLSGTFTVEASDLTNSTLNLKGYYDSSVPSNSTQGVVISDQNGEVSSATVVYGGSQSDCDSGYFIEKVNGTGTGTTQFEDILINTDDPKISFHDTSLNDTANITFNGSNINLGWDSEVTGNFSVSGSIETSNTVEADTVDATTVVVDVIGSNSTTDIEIGDPVHIEGLTTSNGGYLSTDDTVQGNFAFTAKYSDVTNLKMVGYEPNNLYRFLVGYDIYFPDQNDSGSGFKFTTIYDGGTKKLLSGWSGDDGSSGIRLVGLDVTSGNTEEGVLIDCTYDDGGIIETKTGGSSTTKTGYDSTNDRNSFDIYNSDGKLVGRLSGELDATNNAGGAMAISDPDGDHYAALYLNSDSGNKSTLEVEKISSSNSDNTIYVDSDIVSDSVDNFWETFKITKSDNVFSKTHYDGDYFHIVASEDFVRTDFMVTFTYSNLGIKYLNISMRDMQGSITMYTDHLLFKLKTDNSLPIQPANDAYTIIDHYSTVHVGYAYIKQEDDGYAGVYINFKYYDNGGDNTSTIDTASFKINFVYS